jgi:hypothetical protein
VPASVVEVEATLAELQKLLADTGLRIASLGFETPLKLHERLQDIAADDACLTQLHIKKVFVLMNDGWIIDQRRPMGW